VLRVTAFRGRPAAVGHVGEQAGQHVSRLTLPALPIERLWQVVAVLAPIIMTAGAAAYTIDTWWDLSMGRLMIETGRPLVDTVLSFAPAAPGAVHGQWLSHVLLYAAYALGGDLGLRLFAGGIAALTFGLLLAVGTLRDGTTRTTAVGALLAVFIAANNLGLRAQLFSYLLLALVSLLLTMRQRHPRAVFALPIVFAIWANLHGAFLMGLALLGLHAADETLDGLTAAWATRPFAWRGPLRLWAILGLAVLAAGLNPLGLTVYSYIWSVASNGSNTALISEWQPTTIQDFTGQALATAGLLLALVMWKSKRPVPRLDVVTLVAFGLLALTSQRQVVWWGLLAGPILAGYAAALPWPSLSTPTHTNATSRVGTASSPPPRTGEGSGVGGSARPASANWLLATLLSLVAVASPIWRPGIAAQIDGGASSTRSTPSGVATAASTLPPGARMFVSQPWTGYVAWRLWPAQQSMVDARFEAHPTWVWDDYQAVSTARADWDQILDRYAVEYLVLDAGQQDLLARLALRSGQWAALYQDDTGVILQRRSVDTP
jgi:hypothetical protein